jgi:cytochrome c
MGAFRKFRGNGRRPLLSGGFLVAALAAVTGGAHAQTPSQVHGKSLVQRNCAMCHTIEPTGASPNHRAPAFRDLHLRYPVENLGEALSEGILVGHPEMPEMRFEGHDVEDIINYLKSIQTEQSAEFGVPHPVLRSAETLGVGSETGDPAT